MGGYKDLLVYRLAVTIDDGTYLFCKKFFSDYADKRTVEQMIQASRSGKQNIVEGSLEKSHESNIKLTGVARASYGELSEDFNDYLRRRNLPIWNKNDPRVLKIRAFRESVTNSTNLTNLSNWSNLNLDNSQHFANLMLSLIFKETFLLDKLLQAQEKKFVEEGGFRENLFKKRREFLNNKLV